MRRALPFLAALGLLLSGCGGSGPTSSDAPDEPAPGTPRLSGTVTVFAAASLRETFTAIGQRFEALHPGTRVVLNFGPSSGLAAQIREGAPADVFASASQKTMDQVVAARVAESPTVFAANVMQIAVPADNPGGITALADLADISVKVALCQDAVPCGAAAATVFAKAGLRVTPVSEEIDVRAVLTKVRLGEVDAGLVYVTDVKSAGPKVRGIPIPHDVNASTAYPIATLTTSANKATADAFRDLVLSAYGAGVLADGGFRKPEGALPG